jgi:hypothetical protein
MRKNTHTHTHPYEDTAEDLSSAEITNCTLRLAKSAYIDFFVCLVALGLNSGPHTCEAGAVPLEPLH